MCPIVLGPFKINGMQNSSAVNMGSNILLSFSSFTKANRGSGENFGDLANSPVGVTAVNDTDINDHIVSNIQFP